MNQIAIGDSVTYGGWLVLHGQSIANPFKHAVYQPEFSIGLEVRETMLLSLEGTPAALAGGVAALETVIQRNDLYHQSGYPAPQCLRFQMAAGGEFYYAPIRDVALQPNPDSPNTRQTGSLLITLHFTRPNHYDSDPIELPLSGRAGQDVLGGFDLINHTDYHTGHGNSALIKPDDIDTDLPAPMRVELINTTATGVLHDLFVGLYHHPENDEEEAFFYYASDFNGGSLYSNPAAINTYYTRLTWSVTDWTALGSWLLQNETVRDLAGRSYRPILRFYNPHAYDDLLMKIKLQAGTNILWAGESVYVDQVFGYVLFPPVQIPPDRLLNEALPHHVDLFLYGQHDTASAYSIDFDCLLLLPLEPGANFIAFYDLFQNAKLIDDNFLKTQVTHFSGIGAETVSHIRQGGELLVWPGRFNRLIFVMMDATDQIDILRTAQIRIYYRKRRRVL